MAIDVLTEVFENIQLNTYVHFRFAFMAPWGISIANERRALFCFISGQSCLLTVPRHKRRLLLHDGDLVILPRAGQSIWQSDPDAPILTLDQFLAKNRLQKKRVQHVGTNGSTVITGGSFWTDDVIAHPLLSALPEVMHLPHDQVRMQRWIGPTLDLMRSEFALQQAGSSTVLRRLTDVLLIQALRAHLEAWPADAPGWIRGLGDPRIAPALRMMHAHPERAWSLETLADRAKMSRTAFAIRFKAATGDSPLQYLTRWRMYLAARLLRENEKSMDSISESIGYENCVSFQRAFKRVMQVAPGEYRRRHAGYQTTANPKQ